MLNKNEIIDFFKLHNSHAKKELGQNFLIDKKAIDQIIQAINPKEDEWILEIGPGLGALTDELVLSNCDLTCVEYDEKFYVFLSKKFKNKRINIIKGNFLTEKDFKYKKIVGNIPYYISSEIIERILLKYPFFEEGIFMVQNEFLERIKAKNGKDYNVLNILLEYRTNISALFKVKKDSFFPMPNVDSVVFKIEVKKNTSFDYLLKLNKVVKQCFINRRKTISNNLKSLITNKEELEEILNKVDISPTSRAEQLRLENFIKLTDVMIEKGYIKE